MMICRFRFLASSTLVAAIVGVNVNVASANASEGGDYNLPTTCEDCLGGQYNWLSDGTGTGGQCFAVCPRLQEGWSCWPGTDFDETKCAVLEEATEEAMPKQLPEIDPMPEQLSEVEDKPMPEPLPEIENEDVPTQLLEEQSAVQTITISQCEAIEFRWSEAHTEKQQHVVEYATQAAFDECNLTGSNVMVDPTAAMTEEEVESCRTSCQSKCCSASQNGSGANTTRRALKLKLCDTDEKEDCRNACYKKKKCGDDKQCKVSCREKCCLDDDGAADAAADASSRHKQSPVLLLPVTSKPTELPSPSPTSSPTTASPTSVPTSSPTTASPTSVPTMAHSGSPSAAVVSDEESNRIVAGGNDDASLCRSDTEIDCRDICYADEGCASGEIGTKQDTVGDPNSALLAGDKTLVPAIRWFGDGMADNCRANSFKAVVIIKPDLRNRAQGYMCRGGGIREIVSANSAEKCRTLCETSMWGCQGLEYHGKTRSCALYNARPSIGDPNIDTECQLSAKTCEGEPSSLMYVPPTPSPTKEPSFQPTTVPTFRPTNAPDTSFLLTTLTTATRSGGVIGSDLGNSNGCLVGEFRGRRCSDSGRIGIKMGSATPYCDYYCSKTSNCVAYTFISSQTRCILYEEVPTLEEGDEDDVCKIVKPLCGDGSDGNVTPSPSDAPTQRPVAILTSNPSQNLVISTSKSVEPTNDATKEASPTHSVTSSSSIAAQTYLEAIKATKKGVDQNPFSISTNDPSPVISTSKSVEPTDGATEEVPPTHFVSSTIAAQTNEEAIDTTTNNECVGTDIAGTGCFQIGEECTVGEESCCGRTFKSVSCTCSVIDGVELHGFGLWTCTHTYPCNFLKHTC